MCAPCKSNAVLGLQIDWRPLLPQIGVRCLNVIGCKTGVFPPDGTRVVSQLVPNCAKVKSCQTSPKLFKLGSGVEGWPSAGIAHLADVHAYMLGCRSIDTCMCVLT